MPTNRGGSSPGFHRRPCQRLGAYDWPGNVRELENAVEHAVVLGSTSLILPEDLLDAIAESKPGTASSRASDASFHDAVKGDRRRI